MSVQTMLSAAFTRALVAHRPLADALTGIFDAPPPRAATPHALIGEPLLADWGTKDRAGREGRMSVTLHDAGESPARLRRLAGEMEAAVAAIPGAIGEGWQVASLNLVRTRIEPRGAGRWSASGEWQIRLLHSGE